MDDKEKQIDKQADKPTDKQIDERADEQTAEAIEKATEEATEEESLIDFPCEFPVKVMGAAIPEFHACISKIAEKHDPEFINDETTHNTSKTGKYVSLTLNIHAKDKAQLDRLYQELTDHELVLWAL